MSDNQSSFERFTKRIGAKASTIGTKMVAGSMAAIQSVSATSIAVVLSTALGLGAGLTGTNAYPIEFRDDITQSNKYECLDEYSEAYVGVFGNITEQPLPDGNAALVSRLREINEWSKEYVGQSVSDALVCDDSDCNYYGANGLPQ